MSSDWSGTIERLQRQVEDLQDALRINDKEIERLRGELIRDAAASLLTIKHKDATIATLWDSIQPLRLEVDELRAALDVATADRVFEQERTIATLRKAIHTALLGSENFAEWKLNRVNVKLLREAAAEAPQHG